MIEDRISNVGKYDSGVRQEQKNKYLRLIGFYMEGKIILIFKLIVNEKGILFLHRSR